MSLEEILPALMIAGLTGAAGWGIRLESRVSVLDEKVSDVKEVKSELKSDLDEMKRDLKDLFNAHMEGMNSRLARIERGMNGHLPKE